MPIENQNFVSQYNEIHPLMIATSGGGGHISSIKGIIEFLRNKYPNIHFESYIPVLLKDKPYSSANNQAMQALNLLKKSHIGPIVRSMIKPFTVFSTLPDKDLVIEEMKTLNKSQTIDSDEKEPKPREYSDLLLDVDPAGYLSVAMWNVAIAQDNSPLLTKFNSLKDETDKRNYTTVFHYYMTQLMKAKKANKPFTEIICTQTMSLPALCDAVIEYNKHTVKPIVLHEYMCDLPTKGCVHFFKVLSTLTKAQQKVIKLYGVGMNERVLQHFFQKGYHFAGVYNISNKDNPMVRPGFKNPSLDKSKTFHGKTKLDLKAEGYFTIPADEQIASIMLGSQASHDTVAYVESFLEAGIQKVFVFGGKKKNISDRINAILNRHPEYKDRIIPLGFMDDAQMTPLMTRSNFIVIRGGGSSVSEQLALPHHSEQAILFHHANSSSEILTSGISWEDDNITELMKELKKQNVHAQKTCPNRVKCHIAEAKTIASLKKLTDFYRQPTLINNWGKKDLAFSSPSSFTQDTTIEIKQASLR